MNNLVKDFLVLKMGRIFQKKFILKNLIRRSTYINSDVDSGVAGEGINLYTLVGPFVY